jgi:epoxyqueuosine reductase
MLGNSSQKMEKLKEQIKTEAYNLGFSHIGFTTPKKPSHFDIFQHWLAQGYAADMDYMKREDTLAKREDPSLILPDCKSIIVFGLPYSPANLDKDKFPRIASYAIGEDYHQIIPQLLEKMIALIKNHINSDNLQYKIYTDTGPILERELAQRAGLGWIGKNSCLITPDAGSYLFLSEIFINIAFEPDSPFETDHCGTCTRCIDACPTNCILPNRIIDANKCISYLTIENRKPISEDYRTAIDGWIFGCDICQIVCPWNIRFAKIPQPNYFEPLELIQTLDIINELQIDKKEFKEKFSNSPISRAKYEGYLRNILVAINNHFHPDFAEPVIKFMNGVQNQDLKDLAKWVLDSNKINY